MTNNIATFEAPLTTTIKASDDRDAPWIVVRSRDAAHLESQLLELENGGAMVAIGRLARAFQVKAALGFSLGAKPENPQPESATFTPAAGVTMTATPETDAASWGTPEFTSHVGTDPNWGNPAPASAPAAVGAPMTPFGPAVLLSSAPGAAKPWKAWGDPRPMEVIQKFTKEQYTDNPQDPGLEGGTKRFMLRIV